MYTLYQTGLITDIKAHLKERKFLNKKPSSHRAHIWFYPNTGVFIYDDKELPHKEIQELILSQTLVFKGFFHYQGQKMPRYDIDLSKVEEIPDHRFYTYDTNLKDRSCITCGKSPELH